ncbi:N-acetyltransferase [bacterium]|nr:MAG: N-acetyltransferase [bacterium]
MRMSNVTVAYAPDKERYEIKLGDEMVGYATARRRGGVVTMPHVEITPAHRGKDMASRLVRGALEDVRTRGERVVALCPFVVAFLRRNPGFRDLVA